MDRITVVCLFVCLFVRLLVLCYRASLPKHRLTNQQPQRLFLEVARNFVKHSSTAYKLVFSKVRSESFDSNYHVFHVFGD